MVTTNLLVINLIMSNIVKKPNVDPQQCNEAILALRDSMEICAGKWKLMIILYLIINEDDRRNYFLQLMRGIQGISAKMLSKELKNLEMNGLVKREVQHTQPTTVAYSITDYGKSFLPVAEALVNWGLEHRKNVKSKIKS